MEEEELLLDKYTRLIKKLRTLSDSDAAKEIFLFFSESFAPLWIKLQQSLLYDFTLDSAMRNTVIRPETLKKALQNDQEEVRLFHAWMAKNKDSPLSHYVKDLKPILSECSSIITKPILKLIKKIRKEGGEKNKEAFFKNYRPQLIKVHNAYNSLLLLIGIRLSEDVFFEKDKRDKFKWSKSYERLDRDRQHLDDIKINVLWRNIITIYSFLAKGSVPKTHEDFLKDLYDEYFQYYDITLAEISGAGKIDLEKDIQELRTVLTKILDGLLEGNITKVKDGLYTHFARSNNDEIKKRIVLPLIVEKRIVKKRLDRVVEMKKLLEKKKKEKEKKRKNKTAHVLRVDQLRAVLTAIEKMAIQQQQQQDFSIYHDATLTEQEYEKSLQGEPSPPVVVPPAQGQHHQQQQQQQLTAQSFFREIFHDKYPSLGTAQGAQAQFRGQKKETVYRDNTHRLITALSQSAVWQSLLHNVTPNVYFIDMANVLKTCPIPEWRDLTFLQRKEFILSQYAQIPGLLKRHYLNRFTGEPMKHHQGNELYVLFGQKNMENASDDIVYVNQPNRQFIIILVGCFDRTQNCNCMKIRRLRMRWMILRSCTRHRRWSDIAKICFTASRKRHPSCKALLRRWAYLRITG